MIKKISMTLLAVTLVAGASAAPTIQHDHISPWSDIASAEQSRFEPAIQFQGCQPYPVINHEGYISGGLKASGGRTSGCSDASRRQVQIRSHCFASGQTSIEYGFGSYFVGQLGSGEVCAHMYSYYFPKDYGSFFGIGGHRHDWESVIVWTRDTDKVIGVSYSGHGEFLKLRSDDADRIGTHAKVDYTYRSGDFTHAMREGTSSNNRYVTGLYVNSWHAMAAYRTDLLNALEGHSFGKAVYPQGNERFAIELQRAWDSNWANYGGSYW